MPASFYIIICIHFFFSEILMIIVVQAQSDKGGGVGGGGASFIPLIHKLCTDVLVSPQSRDRYAMSEFALDAPL